MEWEHHHNTIQVWAIEYLLYIAMWFNWHLRQCLEKKWEKICSTKILKSESDSNFVLLIFLPVCREGGIIVKWLNEKYKRILKPFSFISRPQCSQPVLSRKIQLRVDFQFLPQGDRHNFHSYLNIRMWKWTLFMFQEIASLSSNFIHSTW